MKFLPAKADRIRSAFSLIETLMVVAVMSSITAGGIFVISNLTKTAENTKLKRDVIVVNNAIKAYQLNGGTFLRSDLQNPAAVLAKLKKRATDRNAKEIAGLRGSMMDARLSFEMQSTADAQEGAERARFIADPANPRFVIQRSGPPGISRFVLDENLASIDSGTEERSKMLGLAKTDPWVWDYTDQPAGHASPSLPPPRNPSVTNPNPVDVGNITLSPPDFSLPSGTEPLQEYPRTLALLPTNPSGSAQIVYSINGKPFTPYTNPINVDPGMTVTAISVSLNVDRYDDSPSSSRTYNTTPVTPLPAIVFEKSGYTYFELGGIAAPGTPPPQPSGSVNGTGMILNTALIPAAYQNSSVFRFVWTLDGTNPLAAPAAQRQADFRDGFTSAPLPAPLEAFTGVATITVQAAVKAENRSLVTDSSVVSRTVNVAALPLRAPEISIDGRDVTLSLNVSQRDMPKDARIFYTTDGTDPGKDAAGNPQRGTLYSGAPFTLEGPMGSNMTVRARVYAPANYRQFFTVSPLSSTNFVLPASTEVYVGGNFVNPSGSPMRNIARLGNSGQVDPRFNTGRGASDDSMIGIVRQTAAGLVAGGDFETIDGSARMGLVRFTETGAVDTGFDADLSAN